MEVAEGGDVNAVGMMPVAGTPLAPAPAPTMPASEGEPVAAPLAGNIWKVHAKPGQSVQEGDVLLILEAMKMETEVRAHQAGTIGSVFVKEGDSVVVGDPLLNLA